jgi:hypothetical protein
MRTDEPHHDEIRRHIMGRAHVNFRRSAAGTRGLRTGAKIQFGGLDEGFARTAYEASGMARLPIVPTIAAWTRNTMNPVHERILLFSSRRTGFARV